jgi:hypothetical protein
MRRSGAVPKSSPSGDALEAPTESNWPPTTADVYRTRARRVFAVAGGGDRGTKRDAKRCGAGSWAG